MEVNIKIGQDQKKYSNLALTKLNRLTSTTIPKGSTLQTYGSGSASPMNKYHGEDIV